MRLPFARQGVEPALDQLHAAWAWWLGEVRGLVPSALRRRVVSSPPVLVLEFERDGVALIRRVGEAEFPHGRIGADEASGESPAQLVAALAGCRPDRVELRLPATRVLHQRLTLPLASPRRLSSLLRFELDRQTPFTPEQVYSAARIVARDRTARRMCAELVLVKRAVADWALDSARRWGLTPYRLGIQGESGWVLDFRPERPRKPAFHVRHGVSAVLAASTVALTVAAWYVHLEAQSAYAEALAAELARSRAAAEATKAIQKEIEKREARLAFLAGRRQAIGAGAVLEDLAERLPDDSWVSGFELTGKTLRIQGFSAEPAALPGLLGQSALLAGIHSSAPPLPAGYGIQRFDLSVDLADGSAE
jgi:general secretion pathway protein L